MNDDVDVDDKKDVPNLVFIALTLVLVGGIKTTSKPCNCLHTRLVSFYLAPPLRYLFIPYLSHNLCPETQSADLITLNQQILRLI